MALLYSAWGSTAMCIVIWLLSFALLPHIERVNLVQRLNFGTINAVFALLFLHLVLAPGS